MTIPAGVTDGQRIRLAGQGGRARAERRPGDLYLVVRLAPHPRYRLDGRDIYVDLPLAPWEAALGASVAVDTPGGEAKVRVKAGTSSGKRLRLRGTGPAQPAWRSRRPLRRGAGSWCRRRSATKSADSSRSWPPSRPSTQGGSGDLRARSGSAAGSTWTRSPRAAGLHPDLVRRLVALGLLDAGRRCQRASCGSQPGQVAAVARIQRLRAGLSLNYAALGVVVDLLDRIAELEAALRAPRPDEPESRPWT